MRKIFKYELTTTPVQMPKGAEILTVQMQNGIGCIWAIVDPDVALRAREINIVPTGIELTGDEGKYIGTIQTNFLVFHIFDGGEE